MKTSWLYFFIFFNFCAINAQDTVYQILIIDKDFENVIENAVVVVFKTKENYISNKDGIVKFGLKGSSFVEISHQDYKTEKIRITSSSKQEIRVLLESKIKQLEEVIVTQIHPQEILKSVIENSLKKLTIPANLKIYNKEFYRYNDEYVFFSDGLLNFQIYKKSNSIKSDILIEQSRSLGLKKPIEEEVWGYDLNAITEKYYSFGYITELLEKKSRKEYNFYLKNHSTDNAYNIIEIKPLDEIEKLFYSYKITFDSKDKLIFEIEIKIPDEKASLFLKKSDAKNRKIIKMNMVQKYFINSNYYYLFNSTENIAYFKKTSNKEVKIEVKNIMHTKKVDESLFSYKDNELFKKKSLILSDKNKIITNYWEFESGIYMTDEEKKIIDYLEMFTSKND